MSRSRQTPEIPAWKARREALMWDAFVDAWAIATGRVPAPPEASEELKQAASMLLGVPEAGLMEPLDGAQATRLRGIGGPAFGPCLATRGSAMRSFG
jgi:hypothetical protein